MNDASAGSDRKYAIRLIDTTDAHFAWMLGESGAPDPRLHLPIGGLESTEILAMLRSSAAKHRALRDGGNWMIVVGDVVVGLCSYKGTPDSGGVVEIGYGIASAHRRRGYATQAVAAILRYAGNDPAVRCVTAGTAPDNIASHRVLERNGFIAAESYVDPKWGASMRWRRDLGKAPQT